MKRLKPARDESAKTAAGHAAAPAFELDQHLFFWFTQVLDRRDRHLAAALKPYSLRAPEWRALASLHSRHALSMSELADLTSIERTTLSRTVERMVRKGWVVRLSDTSDMRVTRLAPTAAGEKLFVRIWPAVQRLNEVAVGGLPVPVAELLRWALQQMRHSLDESLSVSAAQIRSNKRRAA
jgi:MarR family transcriptional regulator, multiple antibiotic resistance protein MarR